MLSRGYTLFEESLYKDNKDLLDFMRMKRSHKSNSYKRHETKLSMDGNKVKSVLPEIDRANQDRKFRKKINSPTYKLLNEVNNKFKSMGYRVSPEYLRKEETNLRHSDSNLVVKEPPNKLPPIQNSKILSKSELTVVKESPAKPLENEDYSRKPKIEIWLPTAIVEEETNRDSVSTSDIVELRTDRTRKSLEKFPTRVYNNHNSNNSNTTMNNNRHNNNNNNNNQITNSYSNSNINSVNYYEKSVEEFNNKTNKINVNNNIMFTHASQNKNAKRKIEKSVQTSKPITRSNSIQALNKQNGHNTSKDETKSKSNTPPESPPNVISLSLPSKQNTFIGLKSENSNLDASARIRNRLMNPIVFNESLAREKTELTGMDLYSSLENVQSPKIYGKNAKLNFVKVEKYVDDENFEPSKTHKGEKDNNLNKYSIETQSINFNNDDDDDEDKFLSFNGMDASMYVFRLSKIPEKGLKVDDNSSESKSDSHSSQTQRKLKVEFRNELKNNKSKTNDNKEMVPPNTSYQSSGNFQPTKFKYSKLVKEVPTQNTKFSSLSLNFDFQDLASRSQIDLYNNGLANSNSHSSRNNYNDSRLDKSEPKINNINNNTSNNIKNTKRNDFRIRLFNHTSVNKGNEKNSVHTIKPVAASSKTQVLSLNDANLNKTKMFLN